MSERKVGGKIEHCLLLRYHSMFASLMNPRLSSSDFKELAQGSSRAYLLKM